MFTTVNKIFHTMTCVFRSPWAKYLIIVGFKMYIT